MEGTLEADDDYKRFVAVYTGLGDDAEESKAEAKTDGKPTSGSLPSSGSASGAGAVTAAGKVAYRTPLVDFLVKAMLKERESKPSRSSSSSRSHSRDSESSKLRAGLSYAGAAQSPQGEGGSRAVTKADERRAEAEKRRQRKMKERRTPRTRDATSTDPSLRRQNAGPRRKGADQGAAATGRAEGREEGGGAEGGAEGCRWWRWGPQLSRRRRWAIRWWWLGRCWGRRTHRR